jgi:hypothetical protein
MKSSAVHASPITIIDLMTQRILDDRKRNKSFFYKWAHQLSSLLIISIFKLVFN